MSNMPPLRTVHGRGAFMSRPRHTWRGYRPPRSARRRWEIEEAARKVMEARKVVDLPGQPDGYASCQEPACLASKSMGVVLTRWQHHVMHQLNKEENVA